MMRGQRAGDIKVYDQTPRIQNTTVGDNGDNIYLELQHDCSFFSSNSPTGPLLTAVVDFSYVWRIYSISQQRDMLQNYFTLFANASSFFRIDLDLQPVRVGHTFID